MHLWLFLFLAIGCAAEESLHMQKMAVVGKGIPFRQRSDSQGICMVSPAQMDACAKVMVAEVRYTCAYRKRRWGRNPVVTYMHTRDFNFRSPSGQRVGDTIEVDYGQVFPAPGFEVYAGEAVGGWRVVVGFNGKVTPASGPEAQVELTSLKNAKGKLRLRILGFTAD